MISFVLPTRDRPAVLRSTLAALQVLPRESIDAAGGAEVIVVDNASAEPVELPARLENGWPVRGLRRPSNEGAAARNVAAAAARGDWLLMLDDDSFPLGTGFLAALREAPPDLAAIGAEILLPDGRHESGGLPEVFIGCGALIRRNAFLETGGYDPAFEFYVEEYDLCARLIMNGRRITHDRRFRVLHRKVTVGRDMNRILHRLVRNNGWVTQRYAPTGQRASRLARHADRYRRIAAKEVACDGFESGRQELARTIDDQPTREMTTEQDDRFTGLAAARETLGAAPALRRRARVAIVDPGKHAWAVRAALVELGHEIIEDEADADVLVIGTLSPGPMLDALRDRESEPRPIIAPWNWEPVGRAPGAFPAAITWPQCEVA